MSLPLVWGATEEEVRRRYPADDAVSGVAMTRAISVAAAPPTVWRWLCQLAVAPYSYDWIDNLGRRSPTTLTPGADELVIGQTMATVLRLTSFEAPHQWTGVTTSRGARLFGPVAMTYAAEPDGAATRLVVRLVAGAGGPVTRARAHALAWGDLVMMRKQLIVLRELAERSSPPSDRPAGGMM